MKHYVTIEKDGYRFVCTIPTLPGEKLEIAVEVFRREERVREFAVPLSRMPKSGVDMADTITLQWEIDRFLERGTGRRTRKRVR